MRSSVIAATLVGLSLLGSPAGATRPTEIWDVTYAMPSGEPLKLDVFLPSGPGPHPGVIVIHGGSWSSGSRADVAFLGRWLAERGSAAFAIDYRLAPRHAFPAALRDAQAAVRWVRENARTYNVMPSRLSAFGVSAGGHLAALLGVVGEGSLDRGSRIRAAVSWSGPMDLVGLLGDTHPRNRPKVRSMLESFVGCVCLEPLRRASPVSYVDRSDASILLVSGASEALPIGQSQRMSEVLDAEGVPHRAIEVPGSLHAEAFAYMLVEGGSVVDASVAFLTDQLERRGPAGPPFRVDPRLFLVLAALFAGGAVLRAALVPPVPLHRAEVS